MSQEKLVKTKYIKGLFWCTVVNVIAAVVSAVWVVASAGVSQILGFVVIWTLCFLGILCAIKLFNRELLGLQFAAVYFGMQMIAIASPSFNFNFIHGISLNLSVQAYGHFIQLNFFALIIFVLTIDLILEQKRLREFSKDEMTVDVSNEKITLG